jgi:hypothetical protein
MSSDLFNITQEYSYLEACNKVRTLIYQRFKKDGKPTMEKDEIVDFCKEHNITVSSLYTIMSTDDQTIRKAEKAGKKIRKYPGIIVRVFNIFGYEDVKKVDKIFFTVKVKK